MRNPSELQLPPPRDWQVFEDLCCDLWKAIWGPSSGTQRFGAGGESQAGVDVLGRPGGGSEWAGVQCKVRDQLRGKRLTKKQIEEEVAKAETFNPRLSHFVIATTAPKSGQLQQAAIGIAESQRQASSFPIEVWAWEDILLALGDHPEVVEKHFDLPGLEGEAGVEEEYLRGLWARLQPLRTVGVTRRGSRTELPLWAVYTVLDTTSGIQIGDPAGTGGPPATAVELSGVEPAAIDRLVKRVRAETDKEGRRRRLRVGEAADRRITAVEAAAMCPRLVLLGDPGGGKSTFVRYLALSLVGDGLGQKEANLRRLNGLEEDAAEGPPDALAWSLGALLPVFVELRRFVASAHFPRSGESGEAEHLLRFVCEDGPGGGDAAFVKWLRRRLRSGEALLVLDGLDETPSAAVNRKRLKEVVASFCRRYEGCRVLVTSRPYAYEPESPWRLDELGFAEARLAPFDDAKIRSFVRGWYGLLAARGQVSAGQADRAPDELWREVQSTAYLRPLAERPLLLTMMTDLHAEGGGRFPGGRAELYELSLGLLLDKWNRLREVDDGPAADEEAAGEARTVGELFGMDLSQVRQALEGLAYRVHKERATAEPGQPAEISGGELYEALNARRDRARRESVDQARVIDYLHQRSGILVAETADRFSFPHRSYQEYLAACELVRTRFPDLLLEEVQADPDLWREVLLLAANKVAGTPYAAWALLEGLVPKAPPGRIRKDDTRFVRAFLAGLAVIEGELWREVQERDAVKLERIRRWLEKALVVEALTSRDRAEAGRLLGILGDRRPGVGLTKAGLPQIDWVPIPAGRFMMGSDDKYDDERPRHEVDLPAYRVGRYSVTNDQYRAFVRGGGYGERRRDCWTDAGWEWKGARQGPDDNLPDEYLLANHPRVNVSWYEAWAFSQWLGDRLGYDVRLPTEAEWEKAARGTEDWIWPWGDEFDVERCNTRETGIGRTSAVGAFAGGASPYGCLDMAGNVWEWTLSLWGKDLVKPEFGYPYEAGDGRENVEGPEDGRRVLRGGSFFDFRDLVRCAYRSGSDPRVRGGGLGFRVVAPGL